MNSEISTPSCTLPLGIHAKRNIGIYSIQALLKDFT